MKKFLEAPISQHDPCRSARVLGPSEDAISLLRQGGGLICREPSEDAISLGLLVRALDFKTEAGFSGLGSLIR